MSHLDDGTAVVGSEHLPMWQGRSRLLRPLAVFVRPAYSWTKSPTLENRRIMMLRGTAMFAAAFFKDSIGISIAVMSGHERRSGHPSFSGRIVALERDHSLKLGLTPDTWRVVGYVRDVLIILVIALGALYLSEHPEKFDAFMYWIIGHRYRH
jgi:hypothetical protein